MAINACPALEELDSHYEDPEWAPLETAVGERLAGGFMWMHSERLSDGSRLHAYKHIHTRRHLYLTEDGRAFERVPCSRFCPLRLDFAIERALCTWWILAGWEAADAEALREAISRANAVAAHQP